MYEYPWSWARRCLAAGDRQERDRLVDLAHVVRVAIWGKAEDMKKLRG